MEDITGFETTGLSAPPMAVNPEGDLSKELQEQRDRADEIAKAHSNREETGTDTETSVETESEGFTTPIGDGSDTAGIVTGDLYKQLRESDKVPVKEIDNEEDFKTPAVVIDLSAYEKVDKLSMDVLKTFMFKPGSKEELETPEWLRCMVYLRNHAGAMFELYYGNKDTIMKYMPEFVTRAFGENAFVKTLIRKPDGSFALRKCSSTLKTVELDFNYWF